MTPLPPEPDFDLIARYYDLLYQDRADDLSLWMELTDGVQGDILEVGCGTGRVMLPLLQAGRRVTGVDISARALEIARAKIAGSGLEARASLHRADMRALDLPQKGFAFAFIPINTFMHCLTTADQQAALRALHDHLRPGGTLVIDLYHPHPASLLEADGRVVWQGETTHPQSGNPVQWFVVRHLHADRQIQEITFLLDEVAPDGSLHRTTFSFPMRYVYRFEMELLLRQSDFRIASILGDYDGSPFHADSPRMIFVVRKPPA
ncbi:MAG: class I SAM-dependent methyltransferase [Caldilineae bacterium]|nr:MAG: class I SAM-dependent methyltransferase [Caldilineae bacterium]